MTDGLPREWMRGPQWTSPQARAEWEPMLRAAAAAWAELEVTSVSAGLRPSALLQLTPSELVQATRDAAGQGLEVTPLAWDGANLRAALHGPGLRAAWLEAWACGADDTIGRLLGFPDCCREHFARTWGRGLSDTVLPMATIDGPPEANVMLRHLGIRLVPHLPCSGSCEASAELGRAFAGLGGPIDVGALLAALALPVEYSALNGVAITTTPHFRIMSGTDWTPDERRASRGGAGTPGAVAFEPASWSDNGFSTRATMEAAHDVVRRVVGEAPGHVLDLGCGDGALLASLDPRGYGIEADAERAARGRRRHSSLTISAGTIEALFGAWPAPFDLVLLMPGRLLEMESSAAERVRGELRRHRRVVVYAYGDWLESRTAIHQDCHDRGPHWHDLAGLAAAAGLSPIGAVTAGDGAQAADLILSERR